jgi:tRNA(adenine34) deaminase
MKEDEKWMRIAIKEAIKAESIGEVPVGAIIVQNSQIIAKAHNQPIEKNDPTAHAEIQAIRLAGKRLSNYRLMNTCLYVTLEPCAMCLGAIFHARIERVVYGAKDNKSDAWESNKELSNEKNQFTKNVIIGRVLETECKLLLQSFFHNRRKKNKYL